MSITRPVQGSLMPDVVSDRPVGRILPSVITGSNADLIAAVAPYYLTGSVLDVTYGDGKWWKRFKPEQFTAHDLYTLDGIDFRALPEADSSVNTVCFDPPYVPQGGTATETSAASFRERFGIDRITSYGHEDELFDLIGAGLTETARVTRCWLLAKCMEFTSSRQFWDMPQWVKARAFDLGLSVHDVIVHHTGSGPGGHNIFEPKRARRHHSYLLVFRKAVS